MIINELKSSYILGEGPDWESKLFVAGNNMLVPEELREIIEQLLSEQPKINSKQIARFFRQREINGLNVDINRTVTEDGIIKFDATFPELYYMALNVVENTKMQKKIQDKVLKPFLKYIKKHSRQITDQESTPLEIPIETINEMRKILKNNPPRGMDEQTIAEYYIYNILNLGDINIQRNAISQNTMQLEPSGINLFTRRRLELQNLIRIANIQTRQNINNSYSSLNQLTSVLFGISSQLYMNSQTLEDKSPEQIEEILKKSYFLYTRAEANDFTYNVDENGYRTVDVGLGDQDVLLHRDGNNIKKAMVNLTTSMKELVSEAETISEDEYLKRVAMLHFRYISIHPFRDSNGRIGRNIVNMLLKPKGKMFIVDRADKNEYLKKMNEMRKKIPLNYYLYCLSENPSECEKYEAKSCEELVHFFMKSTHSYTEGDIHKKISAERVETWENNNRGIEIN